MFFLKTLFNLSNVFIQINYFIHIIIIIIIYFSFE